MNKGYEEYIDQQRRQYANSVPISDWRKQFKGAKSNQLLLDMVPKPGPTRDVKPALDIGAGEGYHTEDLIKMGYSAVGVELLEKRVNDAHKLGRTYVQQGDAHKLPYDDERFNVVFMHEVLEHCVDPITALEEIYRVLKNHGTFVISLPLEGHWKTPQEGHDHDFSIQDTHVWKPTAEMLSVALSEYFTDYKIDLYELGSIKFKMTYTFGAKVAGFRPHAFVIGEKHV